MSLSKTVWTCGQASKQKLVLFCIKTQKRKKKISFAVVYLPQLLQRSLVFTTESLGTVTVLWCSHIRWAFSTVIKNLLIFKIISLPQPWKPQTDVLKRHPLFFSPLSAPGFSSEIYNACTIVQWNQLWLFPNSIITLICNHHSSHSYGRLHCYTLIGLFFNLCNIPLLNHQSLGCTHKESLKVTFIFQKHIFKHYSDLDIRNSMPMFCVYVQFWFWPFLYLME